MGTVKKVSFILVLLFTLTSCVSEFYETGDYFFITADEAVMPVWVRGQLESSTAVIFIHGGPNDGAIHFALAGWPLLEDNYMTVWYDQRHAGQAQGNPDISSTTMEDYTADLDLLIDTLLWRYDQLDSVILMGTSWGTAVFLAYLSEPNLAASEIQGGISLFGTHDFTYSYASSRQRILATEGITEQIRGFYEDNLRMTSLDQLALHMGYVTELGGFNLPDSYPHVENSFGPDYIFASPVALFPMLLTNGVADSNEPFMLRILTDDRLSVSGDAYDLSSIDVPVLLVSGQRDLTAPSEVSAYIASQIPESEHHVLPDTAHFSFGTPEDRDRFEEVILMFLQGSEP